MPVAQHDRERDHPKHGNGGHDHPTAWLRPCNAIEFKRIDESGQLEGALGPATSSADPALMVVADLGG